MSTTSQSTVSNRNDVKISCRSKKDKRWIKWMEAGHRLGCHQKPERSFFIGKYQMPVCARCTGVFIGYIIAIATLIFSKPKETIRQKIAVTGSLAMLTDWSLQAFKIRESTNTRRLATGIAGGFGIMSLWVDLLKWIARSLCHRNANSKRKQAN